MVDVDCRSENGVLIYGWEQDGVEDLVLENVRIDGFRGVSAWPGKYDAIVQE